MGNEKNIYFLTIGGWEVGEILYIKYTEFYIYTILNI